MNPLSLIIAICSMKYTDAVEQQRCKIDLIECTHQSMLVYPLAPKDPTPTIYEMILDCSLRQDG